MFFDISLPPVVIIMVAFIVLAILSDFLLELVSIRLTLCSGRFQNGLFNQFGQSSLKDSFIAFLFQLISYRKRAFFVQLASFINVGSFTKRQVAFILTGAFIGMGASVLCLAFINPIWGLLLLVAGFVCSLFSKDQLKDLGLAVLSFGLLVLAIFFFDQVMSQTSVNIHHYDFQQPFIFLVIIVSSLFFRTPISFLLMLSMFHFLLGLNTWWLPLAYFVHGLVFIARYYTQFLKGHRRLVYSLGVTFVLQLIQLCLVYLLVFFYGDALAPLLKGEGFLGAFQVITVGYAVYFGLSLLLAYPVLFLVFKMPFFNESERRAQTQKILSLPDRGNVFSIHFSLFLLRQEFVKFTTLVHTIFKLSREADAEEETINERLSRYQRIMIRVGDEIKELCFNVGRQRSYRWHVKEILSFYKYVNQLGLIVDDLSQIFLLLQEEDIDEEWEKECRFWLSLQLMIFESFFNFVVGVGKDDSEKINSQLQKSYDVLSRLFAEEVTHKKIRALSKNFYRVTESNGNLAL